MSYSLIEATPSAYAYPLLIKSLLHSALTNAPDQEIVYADRCATTTGLSGSASAGWPVR